MSILWKLLCFEEAQLLILVIVVFFKEKMRKITQNFSKLLEIPQNSLKFLEIPWDAYCKNRRFFFFEKGPQYWELKNFCRAFETKMSLKWLLFQRIWTRFKVLSYFRAYCLSEKAHSSRKPKYFLMYLNWY